jgi:hypothetical protein
MPKESGWTWSEGVVDTNEDHFELTYGDVRSDDSPILVALIGHGEGRTFLVQFLDLPKSQQKYLFAAANEPNREQLKILERVKSELDFYLVEKGEPDPWGYAKYHCGTASNLYSKVRWGYYPKGWKKEH